MPLYHPPGEPAPDTSIVSEDVATGAIRTLLSGRDFAKDQLDLADTPHAPGSSFKPYVLTAAFEEGIPPTQTYSSKSPYYPPGGWPGSACNCVENAEGPGNEGMIDLYTATTQSVNVVFAQLIQDVGAQNVVNVAHEMGVTSDLPAVNALATGSVGVTPLDQASGYQTLANEGMHCIPYTVESISTDTQTIYRHKPQCTQVVPPDIAHLVTTMLESVVTSGTGVVGRPVPLDRGGQDRDGGRQHQRLVRGLHGAGRHRRLGRLAGHLLLARRRLRRHGGRAHLAQLHGTGDAGVAGRTLPVRPHALARARRRATSRTWSAWTRRRPTQTLQSAGLVAAVQQIQSSEPVGTVVSQSPPAGSSVAPGSTVTMQVSNGQAPATGVPNVVGMSQAAAQGALSAAGFQAAVVQTSRHEPQPVRRGAHPVPGRRHPGDAGDHGHDHRGRPRLATPPSRARTFCWTTVPSTCPFALPITKPITLPSSLTDVAPVAASASIHERVDRSVVQAAPGPRPRARHVRRAPCRRAPCGPRRSNASIDSARFLTSLPATSRTSSSESSCPSSSSL